MHKLNTARLVLVAALLLLNCDIFGSKEDYYPTTIGSVWNWFSCSIMQTGTDASPDTIEIVESSTRATKNEKLATGEDVVELVKTATVHIRYPFDSTYTICDTCYVREDKNWVLSYESRNDIEPETTLALPLATGKTWRVTSGLSGQVLGQENVTVRAGSYSNAWKIELTNITGTDTFKVDYWYANRVGNVMFHSEHSYANYTVIYHGELVSANIK